MAIVNLTNKISRNNIFFQLENLEYCLFTLKIRSWGSNSEFLVGHFLTHKLQTNGVDSEGFYSFSVVLCGAKQNALDLDAFKVGPYFDKAASKNVTALLGKTAYLNCRVKNLGNKTVS